MAFDFSNPIVLIIAGILFLTILFYWNKRNAVNRRERRGKNFRSSYYERKKEREKEGGIKGGSGQ